MPRDGSNVVAANSIGPNVATYATKALASRSSVVWGGVNRRRGHKHTDADTTANKRPTLERPSSFVPKEFDQVDDLDVNASPEGHLEQIVATDLGGL